MAERRMFSKKIINSARFLKMPVSSQNLYFHLGLHADDDGVVEAFPVMRSIGATEDDLRVLMAKQFIYVLNEDLVSYITDWHEHNKIRADRKVDSMYQDLLVSVLPNVQITERKERADTKKATASHLLDNQWTTSGQPMDGIGKDRLGKDRLGKDRLGKDRLGKNKYGQFENVLLTDDEHQKLVERFPMDYNDRIDNLSEYMASKGKRYKSHYATILAWARKENKSETKPEPKGILDGWENV